jgi:hypothetical protein
MRTLTALVLLAFAGAAFAQVYKYVDDQGVVHYTDKAPTKDAKPVDLPPIQTYSPANPPPALSTPGPVSQPPVLPKSHFEVKITSPSPEETFRDPEPEVNISVTVMPSLAEGFALQYFVDSVAVTPPLGQTSWKVGGLQRGEHRLAVALMDSAGKQVALSAPITVYMMPPTVKH